MRSEPVAIAAAVRACLATAVAFGLGLSGEQVAAVVVAVEAVLAVVVRRSVYPTAHIEILDDEADLADAVAYGFAPPRTTEVDV